MTGRRWASRSCLDGERQTIFVSAAADRPTRLASADAVEGLPIESDLHGSAAYKKQLMRVYIKRAVDEARQPPLRPAQVGRAIPRLESWLKVTGRAEYVHNLACRECCTARSSAARCRTAASSASTCPPRRPSAACTASW